jgi:disulfide bond formation protein DsbB
MATESIPSATGFDWKRLWSPLALAVAALGVIGSLYLSLGMDLKACPLCFYQRAFMMASAGVLLLGVMLPGVPTSATTVLTLPSALAGAAIAAWHAQLDWNKVLECPTGATGVLTAPQEALLVFALLLALLVIDLIQRRTFIIQGLVAFVLGVVLGIACIQSVHPTPIAPTGPLEGCRKYVAEKK